MTHSPSNSAPPGQQSLDQETQFSELLAQFDEALATSSDASVVSSRPFVSNLPDAKLQHRFDRAQVCLQLLDQDRRRQTASSVRGDDTSVAPWGGEQTAGEPAAVPRQIGRFRVIRRLGSGGFGVVFLAEDPVLRRMVAIKMPLASIFQSRELHARFLRECRAAAKLDHPGIVRVLESGDVQGIPYQVAEFVNGERLSDLLKRQRLSVQSSAKIVRHLADAVQHAHDHGVLHRDIKPDNILMQPVPGSPREENSADAPADQATLQAMVQADYIPRITDFGLARVADDDADLSRSGMLVGTPKYMSPEQLKGQTAAHGPQSDIYSLGVVLYELLTGHVPFPDAANLHGRIAVAHRAVMPLRPVSPEVPVGLEAICLKCLNVEPALRYATASELSVALQRFVDGKPVETESQPVRGLASRFKWMVAIALSTVGPVWIWHLWNGDNHDSTGAGRSQNDSSQSSAAHSSPRPPFQAEDGRSFLAGGPVLTTPFAYDGGTPLTIEAWVQPQRPGGTLAYLAGIALQLQENNGRFCLAVIVCPTESSCVVIYTHPIVREGEWNHLAVVHENRRFQLFINGKRCDTEGVIEDDNGTKVLIADDRILIRSAMSESGLTVGSNNLTSTPKHRYPFTGRIHSIRVSEGMVYTTDFEPDRQLSVQPTTTALYNFNETAGSFSDEAAVHGRLEQHLP